MGESEIPAANPILGPSRLHILWVKLYTLIGTHCLKVLVWLLPVFFSYLIFIQRLSILFWGPILAVSLFLSVIYTSLSISGRFIQKHNNSTLTEMIGTCCELHADEIEKRIKEIQAQKVKDLSSASISDRLLYLIGLQKKKSNQPRSVTIAEIDRRMVRSKGFTLLFYFRAGELSPAHYRAIVEAAKNSHERIVSRLTKYNVTYTLGTDPPPLRIEIVGGRRIMCDPGFKSDIRSLHPLFEEMTGKYKNLFSLSLIRYLNKANGNENEAMTSQHRKRISKRETKFVRLPFHYAYCPTYEYGFFEAPHRETSSTLSWSIFPMGRKLTNLLGAYTSLIDRVYKAEGSELKVDAENQFIVLENSDSRTIYLWTNNRKQEETNNIIKRSTDKKTVVYNIKQLMFHRMEDMSLVESFFTIPFKGNGLRKSIIIHERITELSMNNWSPFVSDLKLFSGNDRIRLQNVG